MIAILIGLVVKLTVFYCTSCLGAAVWVTWGFLLGLFGFFGAAHECCHHVLDGESLVAYAVNGLGDGHFDVVGVGEGVDGGGGGDAFGDLAVGCLGGLVEGAALAESVAEGAVSGEG